MAGLPLTLVIKDYDHIAPLACGDVAPEGVDLKLDRDSPNALDRTLNDPSLQAGELSFSRHLTRLATGDFSFVGIPVFTTRQFRHRCFFVRRGSALSSLRDLVGKKVGTNEWPATGNVWTRAALREQGVEIGSVNWLIGSIDGAPSNRPQGKLPSTAQLSQSPRPLSEMLIDGELDALMCPLPPKRFYEAENPIVRLLPDFAQAEMEYYKRTGLFPAHHILGVRRETFERDPWVLRSLYTAFDQSKALWHQRVAALPETTPWQLASLEEVAALMGDDWRPYGLEPNRKMVQALCDEMLAQDLLPERLDGATVFKEFEEAIGK